jgi:hypothetical protein
MSFSAWLNGSFDMSGFTGKSAERVVQRADRLNRCLTFDEHTSQALDRVPYGAAGKLIKPGLRYVRAQNALIATCSKSISEWNAFKRRRNSTTGRGDGLRRIRYWV